MGKQRPTRGTPTVGTSRLRMSAGERCARVAGDGQIQTSRARHRAPKTPPATPMPIRRPAGRRQETRVSVTSTLFIAGSLLLCPLFIGRTAFLLPPLAQSVGMVSERREPLKRDLRRLARSLSLWLSVCLWPSLLTSASVGPRLPASGLVSSLFMSGFSRRC